MRQVISSINVDTLVQPVPTIAVASIWILTKNIFIKVFRLRIGLRCVHVDTQMSSIFLRFFDQGLEVFNTTNTFTNISIVQVTRVVAFTTISFKENTLPKTICVEINFLDTIQGHKEWVLCLRTKVHRDTVSSDILDFFPTLRVVHDATISNGTILPVDFVVSIGIFGDNNLGTWQFLGVFWENNALISFFPLPLRAVNSDIVGISDCFFISCQTSPVIRTTTIAILRITPNTCSKLICRNKSIHVTLSQIFHWIGYIDMIIPADMGIV